MTAISAIVGCLTCGKRANIGEDESQCRGCLSEASPTPLRQWRESMGATLAMLVEDTGLSKRTLIRAERGERMNRDVAETLARHTGKHWRTFRPKKEAT